MDYRIEETLIAIENNLAQTYTLEDLTKPLNLSVSHFQHLFKREIGKSFTQYVRDLRLQKACELLEKTNMRIQEIRVEVGATDDTHFLRDFKRKFGRTPTEYCKSFPINRNG